MFLFFRYRKQILLSVGCLAFMAVCLLFPATKPMIKQARVQFIVDPGHGLPDGGAVGLVQVKCRHCNQEAIYDTADYRHYSYIAYPEAVSAVIRDYA